MLFKVYAFSASRSITNGKIITNKPPLQALSCAFTQSVKPQLSSPWDMLTLKCDLVVECEAVPTSVPSIVKLLVLLTEHNLW